MTTINTNVNSLIAQNALKINNRATADAMAQLSTGKRINSASDDAAGLAVAESMTAQVRSLNVAVRNANDGISLAQTAEGAMVEVSNMVQRMRELAVQAASGTLNSDQKGYLQEEYDALSDQIEATLSDTKWNGIAVLDGGSTTAIWAGADSNTTAIDVVVDDLSSMAVIGGDIEAGAAGVIGNADDDMVLINTARAKLGAVINRLTSAADNMSNVAQNVAESRSRILDTDYATATTELARTLIIQQAGTAVLAQANQLPQAVLALLR
jgi:flagellin